MIIKHFIKQYINQEDVQYIIFHNGSIVFKETIKTLIFLGVFYILYLGLSNYIHWPMLKWIFASIGIIFFAKYCFDFFNKYIDCLILSKDGLTIFSRD
ncbi:TPA: hypothetical protein DEP21_00740 [Patescibacteria group bacterium]|nr:hypothetical protein [Candidatus Gracilibacteria bacterium]